MKRFATPLLALVIAILVAFAGYKFIRSLNFASSGGGEVIGKITRLEGLVEHRLARSVNLEKLERTGPLHHQELIVTQPGALVEVNLDVGTTIRIHEGSRFIAEKDTSKQNAIIGTVLGGSVTVPLPGPQGAFRLFREGREIDLMAREEPQAPVIQEGQKNDQRPAPPGGGVVISATAPDETQATPKPEPQVKAGDDATDRLSNDDVIRHIRGQAGFIQRCYLTFINRQPSENAASIAPTGTIYVGFTVQPNGRVQSAKLVKSDFTDTVLNKCILEVVERTQFRAFGGESLAVREFPITLQ